MGLQWLRDGTSLPAAPRHRVERFSKHGVVYVVWLLEEPRAIATHYCPNENTMPCLGDECPWCKMPSWVKRIQFAAAVLVRNDKTSTWDHHVGVFTPSVPPKLGPGPHRGKQFRICRVSRGTSWRPQVDGVVKIQCDHPPFDITPDLMAMWFPHSKDLQPLEDREPVPYVKYQPGKVPTAESAQVLSAEQMRAALRLAKEAMDTPGGTMVGIVQKVLDRSGVTPVSPHAADAADAAGPGAGGPPYGDAEDPADTIPFPAAVSEATITAEPSGDGYRVSTERTVRGTRAKAEQVARAVSDISTSFTMDADEKAEASKKLGGKPAAARAANTKRAAGGNGGVA